MYKPKSVLENEMHQILWDFEIQTDHLILTRIPDLGVINKRRRTWHQMDLAIPVDHRWGKIAKR